MQQPNSQAASDCRVWRRRLYLMLEPTARQAPGLSITNRCIAGLILLATILTLLETEPVVRALAPGFFITAEAALAMAFLVEYIGRVIAAGEDPRYRGWAGRLRFMASPWAINAFTLRLLKL